jgi:hypothetical protein
LDATQPHLGCLGDFTVKLDSCFKIAHLNPVFGKGFEVTATRE